ncbi:MAG: 4Fe-4S dicluster domain-containing protein [Chloroflexi bacterium]|nr:4Fe-4S dicluster domain-containing protein [Chloroflexota bacterium]
MPYIITDLCTNDGSCVEVCPVACIHTTPDAPQHYIDPDVCIECEQCEIVCPVDAIFVDTKLPAEHMRSIEVNAAFFRKNKAEVGPVPFETAWQMVQAAHDYATQAGIAVSAAVVDESGSPIAVGRMDAADLRSTELALNKAYTSATFHVASAELVPLAREPWLRSLVVSSRGRVMAARGGIAIADGIAIIGAIGVDGGGSDELNVLCCRAGLAVLESAGH